MFEDPGPPQKKSKSLIVFFFALITFFLVSLLIPSFRHLFKKPSVFEGNQPSSTSNNVKEHHDNREIVADREMIQKAMQEVQQEKLTELEKSGKEQHNVKYYYVIELISGGDIETFHVDINAHFVTITSAKGLSTKIARSSIKQIKRYPLPQTNQSQ